MKKFFAFLMAMLMCFSLVACAGGTTDDPVQSESPTYESTLPEDTTSDPTPEETVVDEVVFNPVTLVDNDHIVFRVTSEPYRDDFWDGYTIDVYAENPTDKTIYVALQETSVNGFMIDPYFTQQIAANKKLNSNFIFMKDDLDMNGITESIDEVAFKVAVYDEDWNEIYVSEEVSITFTNE